MEPGPAGVPLVALPGIVPQALMAAGIPGPAGAVAGGLQPAGAAVPQPAAAVAGGQGGAAGLGFPGINVENQAGPLGMAEMAKAIEDVRAEIKDQLRNKKGDKKKKKDKKEKSKRKKKDRRRRRKSSGSSSSSSGNDKSSSRSRSSSSNSSDNEFVQWKDQGSSKSVKAESVRRLEGIKFKARGELLTFAARHPGALSGYFLAMIHQKLSAGRVTRGKQLREVSVSQWAAQHSGLTETRDLREVATLGAVMDCINMRDLSTAMDTLSQRIVAIQRAKTAGCDWKKAEALELVVGNGPLAAASGMLRLTQ
ncbi:unnamed protein product [Polarella glacialis]|uniref:Uncharacterized protein n=1 Tax=Polarella glacialis TaxID=89957 RepID=A0A813GLR7_POLGL|nr:unnamed protein product [Polarella glacialis]